MSRHVAQELGSTMIGKDEVLTCAEMRASESAAIASGEVTGLGLMERAGAAVAGRIRLRWPKPGRVTVLCGPGNNGGDGYVVARLLAQAGWQVRVLGMDNTPGPDADEMKRRWSDIGAIGPLTMDELEASLPADVAVDALFGTGMTRALDPDLEQLLARLGGDTAHGAVERTPVVAVDGPSGLCLDSGNIIGRPSGVPASRAVSETVTFHRAKTGHLIAEGPACCGLLTIADIGLPPVFHAGAGLAWPDPAALGKTGGHKFDHGAVLVIAGGAGSGGAARLSARAALRVGAGLVTLAPTETAMIEHAGPPDALMRKAVDDADKLRTLLADGRTRAVVIGPGCGVARAGLLIDAVLQTGRPCVLDADALTALAGRPAPFDGLHSSVVMTPHGGEFARLFPDLAQRPDRQSVPQDERGPLFSKLDAVREAARRSDAVVLLKGPDTLIAEPGGMARIHSAFDVPWLATAGAGDVLAGIIAGLLARGLPPPDAAATGAFLHAAAARRFGPGLIADDLPDQLPGVFRELGL